MKKHTMKGKDTKLSSLRRRLLHHHLICHDALRFILQRTAGEVQHRTVEAVMHDYESAQSM